MSNLEYFRIRWNNLRLKYNLKNTARSYNLNHNLDEKLPTLDKLRRLYKISWNEFKGVSKKESCSYEKYSTLTEIQLGWKNIVKKYNLENTCESYKKNCHLDPKLSSWFKLRIDYQISWKEFIDEKGYSSLDEIKEIWKNLVIKYNLENNLDSYHENRKLDQRLPSFNYISYNYHINWKQFINQPEENLSIYFNKNKYQSLEENLKAWLYLVGKYSLKNTLNSYRENYHLDDKLYSIDSIFKLYQITWKEFIGCKNYRCIKEIRHAWLYLVKKYNLCDKENFYSENYKKDPMLPSIAFLKKFNITWKEFKQIK